MLDIVFANALSIFFMQIGARFVQFRFTDAQKKIIEHPYTQCALLFAMFLASSRNILVSLFLVSIYYLIVQVLLNEVHPWNIYSKEWLQKEGFLEEDSVDKLKNSYFKNLQSLS